MRLILATLVAVSVAGCTSAPVVPVGGTRVEVPWEDFKLTLDLTQASTGLSLGLKFWAPGMVRAGMFDPFEGVRLILADGSVVESDTRAPEILTRSGGGGNADSERAVLFFTVPLGTRLSSLEIRCGLGVLTCTVEDEITQLMKEEPDRY